MASDGGIGGRLRTTMAWAGESIGRRGLLTTLRVIGSTIADAGFDRRYGTETGGVVDSNQFESTLANRAHAVRYRATRARPFGALLRRLRYLFNPFDAVILGRFIENVRRSLASHPRRIWLIYNTPLHADVVERSGLFTRAETMTLGGIECRVYTHAPS